MTKNAEHDMQSRSLGRPREFDMDKAVDAAMQVFRERGYNASSISDLSAAMNLTAGSIYKAFKDKRAIFLAAFDRYTSVRNASLQQLTNAENCGLDKIRAVLHFYAETSHNIEGRRGCLVVGSMTELATFDSEMAEAVIKAFQRIETLLRDLIRIGQSDGSISSNIDAKTCARALFCMVEGFRIIGKLGRNRKEMIAVADQALHLVS